MTSRDRVIGALNHQATDRLPWFLSAPPAVLAQHHEEFAELATRFPSDIRAPLATYKYRPRPMSRGPSSRLTRDAWGCRWGRSDRGSHAEVVQSPLADPASWNDFRPPEKLLDSLDWQSVDRECQATSQFVLARSEAQPFERLQQLRGTEATFLDLGYGTPGIQRVLRVMHEFFCEEIRRWAETDVDAVELKDTWGYADGMLVSPETWREQFKPLYHDYCEILQEHDKFVFFRSAGDISDIFHDLIEIGVDAISCQVSIMDAEVLARHFSKRVTFCGEFERDWLDREPPRPSSHRPRPHFATSPLNISPQPTDGDALTRAIHQMRSALDAGTGGLIGRCLWTPDMLFSRVRTAHRHWREPAETASIGNDRR